MPSATPSQHLPDRADQRSANLAVSLGELAKADLDASLLLYEHQMYRHSIFTFQQAVEKATKGMGLLLGLVRPDSADLKKVGHNTILAILLRFPERVEELRQQIEATSKSPNMKAAKEELSKLGLERMLPDSGEMLKKLPSKEVTQRQIPMVKSLTPELLWEVTLRLDPSNPRVAVVLKMLDDAEAQWKPIDEYQVQFEKLAPFLGDPDFTRYVLNVNAKAFPEIAPLAFVTMWHERETRYPPIEQSDYWNPNMYTSESGLVKLYPRLYKHGLRLCDGLLEGSRIKLRIP